MESNTLKVKEGFCTDLVKQGDLRLLHQYCVISYLTKGVGHGKKKELIQKIARFTGMGERTIWNWVNNLEIQGFIETVQGNYKGVVRSTIRVVSKDKLARDSGFYSRRSIKFTASQIQDFKEFSKHYVCTIHKQLQSTFRFCYSKIVRQTESLLHRGEISINDCPSSIDKVGCSIRKVCEYTNLSFATVQKYLKGNTNREYNVSSVFDTMKDFHKSYSILFFKENPKYSFKRYRDKVRVLYSLGSTSTYIQPNVIHCINP